MRSRLAPFFTDKSPLFDTNYYLIESKEIPATGRTGALQTASLGWEITMNASHFPCTPLFPGRDVSHCQSPSLRPHVITARFATTSVHLTFEVIQTCPASLPQLFTPDQPPTPTHSGLQNHHYGYKEGLQRSTNYLPSLCNQRALHPHQPGPRDHVPNPS